MDNFTALSLNNDPVLGLERFLLVYLGLLVALQGPVFRHEFSRLFKGQLFRQLVFRDPDQMKPVARFHRPLPVPGLKRLERFKQTIPKQTVNLGARRHAQFRRQQGPLTQFTEGHTRLKLRQNFRRQSLVRRLTQKDLFEGHAPGPEIGFAVGFKMRRQIILGGLLRPG